LWFQKLLFERFVLSISDEAFLLVVLDNYSARWQAVRIRQGHQKGMGLRTCVHLVQIKAKLTNNLRLHSQLAH
jgi:hypothetical protein